MTTTTNVENFCQYKSRFSLIVEQILAFALTTSLVRKVKNLSSSFKRVHNSVMTTTTNVENFVNKKVDFL